MVVEVGYSIPLVDFYRKPDVAMEQLPVVLELDDLIPLEKVGILEILSSVTWLNVVVFEFLPQFVEDEGPDFQL